MPQVNSHETSWLDKLTAPSNTNFLIARPPAYGGHVDPGAAAYLWFPCQHSCLPARGSHVRYPIESAAKNETGIPGRHGLTGS